MFSFRCDFDHSFVLDSSKSEFAVKPTKLLHAGIAIDLIIGSALIAIALAALHFNYLPKETAFALIGVGSTYLFFTFLNIGRVVATLRKKNKPEKESFKKNKNSSFYQPHSVFPSFSNNKN